MTQEQPGPFHLAGLRNYIQAHPRSPLAARYAHALVDAGEYETALTLCRSVLKSYPDFVTLHFVIARALAAQQHFRAARKRVQTIIAEYPGCYAARRLLERIEKLEKQSLLEGGLENKGIPDMQVAFPEPEERQKKMNWSWREHLIPGEDSIVSKRARDFELEEQQDEPGAKPEHHTVETEPQSHGIDEMEQDVPLQELSLRRVTDSFPELKSVPEDDDTDLEQLAGRLDAATLPKIQPTEPGEESAPEFEPVNLESRPATETLAEIYFRQGKYAEAIDAYRKLRDMHREKRYEYTVRISEIKRMLDTQQGNAEG